MRSAFTDMHFQYNKGRLKSHLIIASFWIVFMLAHAILSGPDKWSFYGWLVICCINATLYGYRFLKPYLTIKEGYLIVHDFLNSSSIPLSEETQIKRFAGEYILRQADKKLKFDTQLIDKTSLQTLDSELKRYNIKWV